MMLVGLLLYVDDGDHMQPADMLSEIPSFSENRTGNNRFDRSNYSRTSFIIRTSFFCQLHVRYSAVLLNFCCSKESETLQRKNEGVQCVQFHIPNGSHSKNLVSERCPVPIDSDKRRSTVFEF
ncbi:hypothetical protein TNCV_4630901 [Trichonephila clavipes]|nr:hypothetical protein TNCV_4630901 [Trichonephila clavipes]